MLQLGLLLLQGQLQLCCLITLPLPLSPTPFAMTLFLASSLTALF